MKLIVISAPGFIQDEARIIHALFSSGLSRLHLRKPDWTKKQLKSLISDIKPAFHERLSLHAHHSLTGDFNVTGLHFTEKARAEITDSDLAELRNNGYVLSTSIHAPAQLEGLSKSFDYGFLGPVFDSISKRDYKGIIQNNFYLDQTMKPTKIIAIGGLNETCIGPIKKMNFDGAAVLGAIWNSPQFACSKLMSLMKEISRQNQEKVAPLHFISSETPAYTHLQSIEMALEAGCRWIQLRIKNQPFESVLSQARKAKILCDSYGAKLIINDFAGVATEVKAYGLHLGLHDMGIAEARKIVGDTMIIGGTANTLEDILLRIRESADYIGLGPFRFTTTKQNLSPILGLDGYKKIFQQLAALGIMTPVIAIGGILLDDVRHLREAGAYGIAMSSALVHSASRSEFVTQILDTLC